MTPRWTVPDFFLVVLGGVLGGLVLGIPAALWGTNEIFVVVSMIGQFGGHLAILWLIARTRSLDSASIGLEIQTSDLLYVGIGLGVQIALAILFIPLQQWLVPDGQAQQVARVLRDLTSPAARLTAVVVTTLVAPLAEELMFRGVLLRSLVGRSRRFILIGTSLVFALFHLIGVASPGAAVLVFLQIFLVGLVLAHVTVRHGRLGPAIFLHGGFNILAALVLLLPPEVLEQLA